MNEAPAAWYEGRWPLRLLLTFLALYLAQNAVTSMFFKVTDFEWHLDHARRLLGERPYDSGFVTYLPARLLLNVLYLPLGGAARHWHSPFSAGYPAPSASGGDTP